MSTFHTQSIAASNRTALLLFGRHTFGTRWEVSRWSAATHEVRGLRKEGGDSWSALTVSNGKTIKKRDTKKSSRTENVDSIGRNLCHEIGRHTHSKLHREWI